MITTQCPAAEALTTITQQKCAEDFGQIQKVIFQRLRNDSNTPNGFAKASGSATSEHMDINVLSGVQTLLSVSSSQKIVVSPYLEAPTSEAGDARTSGGGNDSLNGIETLVGANPSTFSAQIRSQQQSVIKAMKALMGESKAHNLGVYLINENGQIGGINGVAEYGAAACDIAPIPVELLFVGDKTFGGFEAPDSNTISWSFRPQWSDNFVVVKPTGYNPLTALDVFAS